MANTCAICGASINIFQSQKLADGNYLCRKTCCEKAMRNFDSCNRYASAIQNARRSGREGNNALGEDFRAAP